MESPVGSAQPHQSKKRHAKYLRHAPKRKKETDLTPGLSGFFITCDAGRERQASREAINMLDEFHGRLLKTNERLSNVVEEKPQTTPSDPQHDQFSEDSKAPDAEANHIQVDNAKAKASSCSISDLLEKEINELQDPKKVRFATLDTGCSGVIFIRMLAETHEDASKHKSPKDMVDAVMQKAITCGKPLGRYCFKILPVEITCYASPDEVKKAAECIILHHFPEGETSYKFAVVYEARANSGVNRMEFIDTVAKLVPKPHSVDLKKPDKTIIIQIIKTICTVGVVENYKEYFKYNLRQMILQKQQQ